MVPTVIILILTILFRTSDSFPAHRRPPSRGLASSSIATSSWYWSCDSHCVRCPSVSSARRIRRSANVSTSRVWCASAFNPVRRIPYHFIPAGLRGLHHGRPYGPPTPAPDELHIVVFQLPLWIVSPFLSSFRSRVIGDDLFCCCY